MALSESQAIDLMGRLSTQNKLMEERNKIEKEKVNVLSLIHDELVRARNEGIVVRK